MVWNGAQLFGEWPQSQHVNSDSPRIRAETLLAQFLAVCYPLPPVSSWHRCLPCGNQEIESQPCETNVQDALGRGWRAGCRISCHSHLMYFPYRTCCSLLAGRDVIQYPSGLPWRRAGHQEVSAKTWRAYCRRVSQLRGFW